jgi:membrane protease YdiL (CAAX protease family)
MQSVVRPVISWLIILGCIFYFVFEARPSIKDSTSAENLASPQFTLQSRYILGAHSLLSSISNRPANQDENFVRVVTDAAKTPVERLRLAAVLGELKGKEAAVEQLDEIAGDLQDRNLERDAMLFRQVYSAGPDVLSPPDQETLITRHGFFGKLALSYGKSAADPGRAQVFAAAKRTAIAAICIVIVGILALLAGFVIFIVAIILFVTGKLHARYQPAPQPTIRFLESFAIYLGSMLLLSLAFRYLIPVLGLWSSSLLLVLVPLSLAWPALRFGIPTTARAIGFIPFAPPVLPSIKPQPLVLSLATEVSAGVLGYLAGLPLFALGLVMTLILTRFAHATPEHPIIYAAGKSARVTFQIYLLACFVAPMVEESLFRGSLYTHLRSSLSWIPAAMITAVIFAIIHPQGWTTLPVLAAIGFTLASIREWRGSLLASMTAHALNNFVATTFLTLALS